METFCEQCQSAHAVVDPDPTVLFGDVSRPGPRLTSGDIKAAAASIQTGVHLRSIDIKARVDEEWMGETPPA